MTDPASLVERIALTLLNDDRAAGGWPAVASFDRIENSHGYQRNAHALLPIIEAERTAAVEAAYRKGLEDAAGVATERAISRERLFDENGGSHNAAKAVEAECIASGIRALIDTQDSRTTKDTDHAS